MLRRLVVAVSGVGTAKGAAVSHNFTLEVDAFAALRANDARTLETGKIFRLNFHFHPLFVKKNFVGELRVGFLLARFLAEFRKHFTGGLLGRFLSSNAHGAAGLEVTEGRRTLPPFAEFQGTFAQPALRG